MRTATNPAPALFVIFHMPGPARLPSAGSRCTHSLGRWTHALHARNTFNALACDTLCDGAHAQPLMLNLETCASRKQARRAHRKVHVPVYQQFPLEVVSVVVGVSARNVVAREIAHGDSCVAQMST
jgi:hypothetical protein